MGLLPAAGCLLPAACCLLPAAAGFPWACNTHVLPPLLAVTAAGKRMSIRASGPADHLDRTRRMP